MLQLIALRAKLFGRFNLLVFANLTHSMVHPHGHVRGSFPVPMGLFVQRVRLFAAIFTSSRVLSATLSVVRPGNVVLAFWHGSRPSPDIAEQAHGSVGRAVARVAGSISQVVSPTSTTPWIRLPAVLRNLGAPRIFTLIIGTACRYIFLLLASEEPRYD